MCWPYGALLPTGFNTRLAAVRPVCYATPTRMSHSLALRENAAAQAAAAEATHLRGYVAAVVTDDEVIDPQIDVTFDNGKIVLATVRDVPLYKTGMKYPASTGPVDFSLQHLASSVAAAADPMIPQARVKLGHTDPRYNDFPCPHCSKMIGADPNDHYFWDGMPNFGFVSNTVLNESGGIVRADLTDVPLWLAEIMPVAFPSRSIEGWFGYTGPNNKEYDFIVTDLALLGVAFPGNIGLSDLPKLYGSEMPDYVEIQEAA